MTWLLLRMVELPRDCASYSGFIPSGSEHERISREGQWLAALPSTLFKSLHIFVRAVSAIPIGNSPLRTAVLAR
jgi:hypothetical protein